VSEAKRHAIALVTGWFDFHEGGNGEVYAGLIAEAGMSVEKYTIIEELTGFVGAAVTRLAAHTDPPDPRGLWAAIAQTFAESEHEDDEYEDDEP
jgi:hypothetical protein